MGQKMRELKFRAWDIDNKQFIYAHIGQDDVWLDDGISTIEMPLHHSDFEQYTGLKDKNGKEIYEGDIVEKNGINYWIKWEDGCFVVWRDEKTISFVIGSHVSWCEVIGNIHENPELLEKE